MNEHQAIDRINDIKHNVGDPNPWMALYVDSSVPFHPKAKANFLVDVSSRSRQFFMPLVRPLCRLTICLFTILKTIVPNFIKSSWLLHHSIYWGLKWFVSPNANYLVMRHFHIGSELLQFVADNAKDVEMDLKPLHPKKLRDLADDVFLQHDLNIYNFIIDMNRQLNEKDIVLESKGELDFSAISEEFEFDDMPNGWFNFIDLEAAIEIYTPMYQLLLTDSDFWRACHSLQLDETIALYVTTLVKDHRFLGLVNNRHPIVPESCLNAGHRLMLHGLAAESLHAFLVEAKKQQAESQSHETAAE